jgi:hypothetical protein
MARDGTSEEPLNKMTETAGTASPALPASGSERTWRSQRASHGSHACLLRRVLSLPPARSAVPCLTSAFYLRELRFSAYLCVNKQLFAVSVAASGLDNTF